VKKATAPRRTELAPDIVSHGVTVAVLCIGRCGSQRNHWINQPAAIPRAVPSETLERAPLESSAPAYHPPSLKYDVLSYIAL